MKRILLIALVFLLAGGGYYVYTNKPSFPSVQQMVQEKAFSSIQDAIAKAVSLKCEVADESGKTVTTYIKGTKVRGASGGSEFLITDNKMYTWDAAKKQGTVLEFDMTQVAEAAKEAGEDVKQEAGKTQNWNDMVAGWEKMKDSCKVENIAESMFAVPADVTFTDVAAEMEKAGVDFQKMMEEAKKITPPPAE